MMLAMVATLACSAGRSALNVTLFDQHGLHHHAPDKGPSRRRMV